MMKPPTLSGVMLNAYPDSIGEKLSDVLDLLERPELRDVFSLFYVLPTFFNSDLDRGFSVIDYDLNDELVSRADIDRAEELGVRFKFDLVLNHLSVNSPQFLDLVENGEESVYRQFFVDWNEFWEGHGEMGPDGYVIPDQEHLDKLFMRKPGLPILQVRFPDGSDRPYWNTFYQQVSYPHFEPGDFAEVDGLSGAPAAHIAGAVNRAIETGGRPADADLGEWGAYRDAVLQAVESRRTYLGQMDLNAESPAVWDFYAETLDKLRSYGANLVRLDAFAYLHKAIGQSNFFNKPGTWDYLQRLREMAEERGLQLLPEIHSEYGTYLHEEVSGEGFPVYDFFLPGLVIDALDRGTKRHLVKWMDELIAKDLSTVNMLGCHDGIPVLDLRGGLLADEEIETVIETILERGGRVKNLYGADGKKISYYQVNATYFSALGEDEQKLLLARAIQLFTPGVPQVWYLDLFAGTNDYAAADRGGAGGHKEINRTTLSLAEVEARLDRPVVRDQLDLLRLRNTSPAFSGELEIAAGPDHLLDLIWRHEAHEARLQADLTSYAFTVTHTDPTGTTQEFSSAGR